MINNFHQAVCDYTSIIVDDGVTVYPGYIEVKKGKIIKIISNDPRNSDPRRNPWGLTNRVEFAQKEELSTALDKNALKKLEGKHFIGINAMDKYIKENAIDKK